jgi:hypothetical protein
MDIKKLIAKIKEGKLSQQELINLYNNANRSNSVSEDDKEKIISAIEETTRLRFPKAANKLFGAKDNQAREILLEIYQRLEKKFNFASNKLRNGVKTGGDMIAGRCFIQVYLSYKNLQNFGASLDLQQDCVDSELKAFVRYYKTGGADAGTIETREYGIDDEGDIFSSYSEFLSRVDCQEGDKE